MRVFISWSGARSRAIAELLNDWIKCVLQASRPWISTRDIDRGALWFSEITDQLKDTTVGIVCLTQENKNRPWILFEAGALAKGLNSNRVCTFLVDLKPTDLEDPLAQFNATMPDKDGVYSLVRTLNSCLGAATLDDRILEQILDTYWAQFETKFVEALKRVPADTKTEPRSEKNLLGEILENTRSLNSRLRHVEMRSETERGRWDLAPAEFQNRRMMRDMAADMIREGASKEHVMHRFAEHFARSPGGQQQFSEFLDDMDFRGLETDRENGRVNRKQ